MPFCDYALCLHLDEAVNNMDNHYATIEQRHTKIIENVQDIQKAINFVSEVSSCSSHEPD